jgi:hypothetical protein
MESHFILKVGSTWMDIQTYSISLSWIYIPNPLNQLEEWEKLKYTFARSQLQVVMPTRINVSCENGNFSKGSHERTRSIPFPPNLEYSHSHSTPPSRVVELSFVGQRRSMLIEVGVHTLAPRVPRSYNERNTPRPNENRESRMASCFMFY